MILRNVQWLHLNAYRLDNINIKEHHNVAEFYSKDSNRTTMSICTSESSIFNNNTQISTSPSLRSVAQQTEVTCRHSIGFDELLLLRPLQSAVSTEKSSSIISSVRAFLLNIKPSSSTLSLAPRVISSTSSRSTICRICFGGSSAERLVTPCSCRGTIASVHRTCLERWLLTTASSRCELCRFQYHVTRSHKWSWFRCVLEWGRSAHGAAFAADVFRGAALGAASVLGTARALHACEKVLNAGTKRGGTAAVVSNILSSLIIGVIGALNGVLTMWVLLKVQEHLSSWQSWWDSTLLVTLTLREDQPCRSISDSTMVADEQAPRTADRSTNVTDPFMWLCI